MRNRRKAAAIVVCALLTASACTSPPASAPTPAASSAALSPAPLPTIHHDVPDALRDAEFFGRPITEFDVSVVPSAGFDKIQLDDPRVNSSEHPIGQYHWCSGPEVQPIGPDTRFALRTTGDACDFDTPQESTPGLLDGDRFIPFTGYTPARMGSPSNWIRISPHSYTDDGVLLEYAEVSRESILWTDFVYARADTGVMRKVVGFDDLRDIDPENYLIAHTINLGAWVDSDTLILSTFMSSQAQNSEPGLGVISVGLDGTNPVVELFDAAPQRWTQRDEPLFATREEGHVSLLRRTGIGQYDPVYTNTETSTYLHKQIEHNWAGMIGGQLLIAVDAGLILADEQKQTITVIEMNPVPGPHSGTFSPEPQLTDTQLLWSYVPYDSQHSGIYALNLENLAGLMTLVDGGPRDFRVASNDFTFDLYKFVYDVSENYREVRIPFP